MNLVRKFFLATAIVVLATQAFTFTPLFNARIEYGVGEYPSSVCASDLDSDGDVDLAVANSFSENVSILLGNGDNGQIP